MYDKCAPTHARLYRNMLLRRKTNAPDESET